MLLISSWEINSCFCHTKKCVTVIIDFREKILYTSTPPIQQLVMINGIMGQQKICKALMKLSDCIIQCHDMLCAVILMLNYLDILKYMNAKTNIVAIVSIDNVLHACLHTSYYSTACTVLWTIILASTLIEVRNIIHTL